MKYFQKFVKNIILLSVLINFSSFATIETFYRFQDPKTNLYGVKNNEGKIIIKPQFELIFVDHEVTNQNDNQIFNEASNDKILLPVYSDKKFQRLTKDLQIKFESFTFDNGPDYYKQGLARFVMNNKVGFHDTSGKIIVEPVYDFAYPFNLEIAPVCQGCYGVIAQGIAKFNTITTNLIRNDELFIVEGGKWGAIDLKGQVVIPLVYNSAAEIEAIIRFKNSHLAK